MASTVLCCKMASHLSFSLIQPDAVSSQEPRSYVPQPCSNMADAHCAHVETGYQVAIQHGPDVSVDQTWNTLAVNLKEVLNNNARHLSFEETIGASSEPTQQSHEAELLLKALRKVWDEHKSNVVKLSQLLNYMVRSRLRYARFYEVTLSSRIVSTQPPKVSQDTRSRTPTLPKHILQPPNAIHSHVINAVLKQIRLEREGYVINRSAVKECVDVFIGLDTGDHGMSVYEPGILSESDAFYKNEGVILLQTCDAPEYLRRVETRFISEEERTHHYLSPQTHPPLRQLLQDHLLTANLVEVISMLGSGFDSMIDTHKYDDLSRMYRLFIMAFETFVNQHERCSEFISLFIDDHLKRGLKGKNHYCLSICSGERRLRAVLQSHLAKRLLHGRSVSDDAERGMLAKLKVECGYQFTHKLEGMFHDMKISDDTMSSYRTYLENTTPCHFLREVSYFPYYDVGYTRGHAISDSELQRHLQTLACAKYKILKKHPPGRDVAKDDSFSFNEDFSAPLQKIKISTVASKVETSEERKETQSHLEEERKYQMEVSLMRNSDGYGFFYTDAHHSPSQGLHRPSYEGQEAHDT
ncbi:Cullin [Salix suchowensis]|nr:Cullin [Salix suchowensis]